MHNKPSIIVLRDLPAYLILVLAYSLSLDFSKKINKNEETAKIEIIINVPNG